MRVVHRVQERSWTISDVGEEHDAHIEGIAAEQIPHRQVKRPKTHRRKRGDQFRQGRGDRHQRSADEGRADPGRLGDLHRRISQQRGGNQDRQGRVLDVGCGTGRGISDLNSIGFSDVTGLDSTFAMLKRASTILRREHSDRSVPLVREDAFRLPFDDYAFQTVVSLSFLHMLRYDRQEIILLELERVCKPGGRIAVEFDSIHK
ncbi:MAG: class I SAM-dependent methyltransferase, partial [Nitrospirae bacterium]|nr:class I SAM-dependent methyltransferase [Nitrospirota bacterium]